MLRRVAPSNIDKVLTVLRHFEKLSDAAIQQNNKSKMKKDILAIGNAIVDILCKVDDDFLTENGLIKGSMSLIDAEMSEKLSKIEFEKISSGGSASNTIAAMAKFGSSCSFIGKVGNDEFGEKFISDLRDQGSEFLTDKHLSKPTAKSFIFVTDDGERTMCTFLGCAPEIDEKDIKAEFFKDLKMLYLEGYLWDSPQTISALKKAIKLAKENNCKIAFSLSDLFCVSRHKEDFLKLIKNDLDIVFANEFEARELGEDYLEIFSQNADLIAIVTKSAQGCEIIESAISTNVLTEPVKDVVDTTGAGDIFAAGFLGEILSKKGVVEASHKGNELASQIIQQYGARL